MAVEVKLIVKSGPGELIANRDFAVVNNAVDIAGIQFSEPGVYVISVTANSPEIENTEFTINVLPEEEVIPQEDTGDKPEEVVDGKRPIIAQIDQPTYKLKPIEFDSLGNDEDDASVASTTGFIPLFSYNDSPVEARYIQKLTIYYEDFVPKCEVILKDALGLINSPKTTALNDTKFDIFLNSGSDVLKSIHLKFKLEVNQKNKSGTNTITGILDIPDFYKISYKSYRGTSFESLRKLSKDLQLGFNSNIENTNDSMAWRRNGISTKQFFKNILEHSYISDDSFMVGYIDFYYSFNYVDVEKEWKRNISSDVGLISQGLASKAGPQADRIVKMILSNDQAGKGSPFYLSNVITNNNSTLQSTQKGNFTISKTYDRVKKQFLKFNIDSLTSDVKEQVVLKGSPGDKTESETNFRTSYGGKIDTSNVHENWSYSVEQNKRNLTNLSNITLKADLPNPNYNLYKFQKIQIKMINQKPTQSDPDIADERLSGEWIIIDIKFIWNGLALNQSIVCARKELGKTTEEKQTQVTEEDKSINNSEINDNPINPEIPNQKYEVGKIYTLQGPDGVRYLYTITSLDDNGIDVTGDIKRQDGLDINNTPVATVEGVTASGPEVSNTSPVVGSTTSGTASGGTASGGTASGGTASGGTASGTVPTTNAWETNKLVDSGFFEETTNLLIKVRIDWEVRNDNNIGFYNAIIPNFTINSQPFDAEELGTFNDKGDASVAARTDAFEKFSEFWSKKVSYGWSMPVDGD